MENYFIKLFDNIHCERSLITLLSLTNPDLLRQTKVTDDEREIFRNIALQKLKRQVDLKQYVALELLEKTIFRSVNQYHIITKIRILTVISTRISV